MKKRLLGIMLILAIVFTSAVGSYASVTPGNSTSYLKNYVVFFQYTSDVTTDLSISGSQATITVGFTGYNGVTTKCTIDFILQKKYLFFFWSDVCSWSTTIYSYQGSYAPTFSLTEHGTYRVKAVYTVYSGSESETITDYSSEVTY